MPSGTRFVGDIPGDALSIGGRITWKLILLHTVVEGQVSQPLGQ